MTTRSLPPRHVPALGWPEALNRPARRARPFVVALAVACVTGIPLVVAPCMGQEIPTTSLDQCLIAAFLETHQGWSTDEVLLQDQLNQAFLDACRRRLEAISPTYPATTGRSTTAPSPVEFSPAALNWRLLNLRKAGKLPVKALKTNRQDTEPYRHLAEIVARFMQDKHRQTTDRILCDPALRDEFNRQANRLAPDVDPYVIRKAALGLRKARRLRPELVLQVADWGREVRSLPLPELSKDPSLAPVQPGIYIFRDATGYLYIGESANLRSRLRAHLDLSDRKSLASYLANESTDLEAISIELHVFPAESRGAETRVRRAYESELIASRKPRCNLRP